MDARSADGLTIDDATEGDEADIVDVAGALLRLFALPCRSPHRCGAGRQRSSANGSAIPVAAALRMVYVARRAGERGRHFWL